MPEENKHIDKTKGTTLSGIKILISLLAVMVAVCASIYTPLVSNWLKGIAESQITKTTGWNTSISEFDIDFPFNINVDGVLILDEKSDTMIYVDKASADVAISSLLKFELGIDELNIRQVCYKIEGGDSALSLSAKVDMCRVVCAGINLATSTVGLDSISVSGGNMQLFMPENRLQEEIKEEKGLPEWKFEIGNIQIHELNYSMKMLPTIDTLKVCVNEAELQTGIVNLGAQSVDLNKVLFYGVNAQYIFPLLQNINSDPPLVESKSKSAETQSGEWEINVNRISLKNAEGLYAESGRNIPSKGIDFNYLQIFDVGVEIDSLYNRGTNVEVPIKFLSATERCGIRVTECSGVFKMDSVEMCLKEMSLSTDNSQISLDACVDLSTLGLSKEGDLYVFGGASLSPKDLELLFPDLSTMLSPLAGKNAVAKVDVNGGMQHLDIIDVSLELPGIITMKGGGSLHNVVDVKQRKGELAFAGTLKNGNSLKSLILDASLSNQINIPSVTLSGDVMINGDVVEPSVELFTSTGMARLTGSVNLDNQNYNADIDVKELSLKEIMPDGLLGAVTMQASADGLNFNPLQSGSELYSSIKLNEIQYNGISLRDINADVSLCDGLLNVNMISDNKDLNFTLDAQSTILNNEYDYNFSGDIRHIDFKTLAMTQSPFSVMGTLKSSGKIDLNCRNYDMSAMLENIGVDIDDNSLSSPLLTAHFISHSDSTSLLVNERDMTLNFLAQCPLDSLLNRFVLVSTALTEMAENKTIDFNTINQCMPEMNLSSYMKDNNIVSSYLNQNDMGIGDFSFELNKDSLLSVKSDVLKLKMGDTLIDTISVDAYQEDNNLIFAVHTGNIPGNMDNFASSYLSGSIGDNSIDAMFNQTNRQGITGFNIGLSGVVLDDVYRLTFFPENPIIGYREWNLNPTNYLEYHSDHKHIDADIDLQSSAGYLSLKTMHTTDSLQEDLVLKAQGINVSEWLNMAPWMPKVSGTFNADASINKKENNFVGTGTFGLNDFIFNKGTLGDIKLDVGLDVNPATGANEAVASILINGRETMSARGTITDTIPDSPYNLKLSVNRFPLSMANPFIPQKMVVFAGYLNGNLQMTGNSDSPVINGHLYCDSTYLQIPMFGSNLAIDTTDVRISKSNVLFADWGIIGSNGNSVNVNGYVNLANLSNPDINLSLLGNDVQVVDSKYKSKSQIFGKGYVDINASAKGRLSKLKVNADIDLLEKTDVTYVLQEDVNSLSQTKTEDVVTFVCFADTLETDTVGIPKEEPFAMNLNARVNVTPGAILNVNLSTDGKNKVQIGGSGNLIYTMEPSGDARMSGRYTISDGFVRYYPPFISEKYFVFKPGSYVSWASDILNPTLSIYATGTETATVVSDGANPVRVNFEVTAGITNTLEQMNIAFDLAAPNNSLVQAELQGMSSEQRTTQAINLMLYGSYNSGNSSSASMSGSNMLYSVLSSQLNNLASKMVKSVDISFGINQYEMGPGNSSSGMNYSYQVSKSLFNNRFRMTVGGNYDTNDSDDANIAQNLFSNVSFEYLITPSGSMSIKVFNQVSDNNIYQTQVNETGVAFLIRRKLSTLKNLFNFRLNRVKVEDENNKNVERHESVSDEKK